MSTKTIQEIEIVEGDTKEGLKEAMIPLLEKGFRVVGRVIPIVFYDEDDNSYFNYTATLEREKESQTSEDKPKKGTSIHCRLAQCKYNANFFCTRARVLVKEKRYNLNLDAVKDEAVTIAACVTFYAVDSGEKAET